MKFLREPLVQFLFLGGLIYFAYGLFAPETEEDTSRNIVVNKSKVQWMQGSWEKRRNRLPTQEELDGLISQYVKETILYNEAIKMGLDRDDGMIRRRLAQKVEFLAKDLVAYTPPTEQDLKKYYDEHQDKYTPDATYTFMQIYFNPDKRGNATLDDVNKAKEILNKEESNIQDFTRFGDNLMVGNYFEATSAFHIRKSFGTSFTQELVKLKPGKWHDTILSGYGVHLVYIKEIVTPPVTPLSQVKDEVLQAWTSERQEKLNEDFYAALKEAYTIVIEDENISVLDVKK